MEVQVTSNTAKTQVRELGLAEEKFLDPVSFLEALWKWPAAVYQHDKKDGIENQGALIFLVSVISMIPTLIFGGVISNILPFVGITPGFLNVVSIAFASTWVLNGSLFYLIRNFITSQKSISEVAAQEVLLDYYREQTNRYREKLVGEEGRITQRDNQLASHKEKVKHLKNRTEDLAENTDIDAREAELKNYAQDLKRQLVVIREARAVLKQKRQAALDWLEQLDSEINKASSRINEEKEYTEIRERYAEISGETNELVSAAMEDIWTTIKPLQDNLDALSGFVESADSSTLSMSEYSELPEPKELEVEDSVEYAKAVVHLAKKDIGVVGDGGESKNIKEKVTVAGDDSLEDTPQTTEKSSEKKTYRISSPQNSHRA